MSLHFLTYEVESRGKGLVHYVCAHMHMYV